MTDKTTRYRVDTLLAHLGRDPKAHRGMVNPPVYHASTIVFDSVAGFDRLNRAAGARRRERPGR